MKYVEVTASEQMTVKEFCKQVKDLYKKILPKCTVITKLDGARIDIIPLIGKLPDATVKDLEKNPNKDFHSDKVYPDYRSFYIFVKNPHMEVPGEPKVVTLDSPIKNEVSLLSYNTRYILTKNFKQYKSAIKKCKGSIQDVLKTLGNNFKIIKKEMTDQLKQGLIYDEYVDLVKSSLGVK